MAGFLALQWLESWGLGNVLVCTDSELLVKGLLGKMMDQHTFNMILRNLTQLRELHLDWLNISSPLPHALLNLSYLTSLSHGYCLLHGKFSDNIFHFPNLRELKLQQNSELTGKLPNFNVTSSLQFLDLSEISFSGQLPNSSSNLKALNILYLFNCNFSGSILASIGNLTQITNLGFTDNSVGGQIPSSISNLVKLNGLYLDGNNLNGQIPDSLGNMSQLTDLFLSRNQLTERLPWKNLWYIDPHSNLLQGPLPVPPNTIIVFSISNNKLSGEIPPLICGLSSLLVLDLSNNSLSGLIPQCLGNLSNSLSVLNLGINSFSGTFAATFTKGNLLRNLNLNGNQIEGQVPRSLLNCEYLEVLDLGKNKINDTFPHWLKTLTELQVLVLRFKRYHGHIGTFKTKSKHPFPKLRIIDISYNEFTGLLPTNYIKQFEAMTNVDGHELKLKYMGEYYYQDSVVVLMKGYEIEYSRILTVFSIIDLSSNKFQGEIPKSIEKLNSLRGLNLSHNNLTGHIPTSLRKLTNLELLDLSSNEFVGKIP
ncbi:receptor-like protein 43 [Camellia sinensis]|uniref:receptor-like protein 43 n=1 Tax=Camellia sinensis TaxID=4442 RepID=UPI001035DD5F|nr:receptor-like protein 43 [Camellia sinensis]